MALKKSDLYSSLWASCNTLRGGMDASQYKDYVLFIKCVSDNYANSTNFAPAVVISKGASFKGMMALTGMLGIGDRSYTQILDPNNLSEWQAELDRVSQTLTRRIRQLVEHLKKMRVVWN